jgi:hypothetical protein
MSKFHLTEHQIDYTIKHISHDNVTNISCINREEYLNWE